MRKVNTLCISKEKAVRHYVDLIVTVFKKNSETDQSGGGGFECQLRTSKNGVCLDQNWMFMDRRKKGGWGPKFRQFL